MLCVLLVAASAVYSVSASQSCYISSSSSSSYYGSGSYVTCSSYCCGSSTSQYCCSDCSLSYGYSGLCPWQIGLIATGAVIFFILAFALPIHFCCCAARAVPVYPATSTAAMATSYSGAIYPVQTYQNATVVPVAAYAPPVPQQYGYPAAPAYSNAPPPPYSGFIQTTAPPYSNPYPNPNPNQTIQNVQNPPNNAAQIQNQNNQPKQPGQNNQ